MRASESDPSPAARRSRTRTRKPKFLSLLRIELSTSPAAEMTGDGRRRRRRQRGRQLRLFPLHPETADSLVDDDTKDDENVNVDLLFNGDDTSATTLSGLLDGGEATTPATASAVACSEEGSVGSRGTDYGREEDHRRRSSLLVRAAMKSGCRDQEEKWVSYSEVVLETKPLPEQEPEEVSSCSAAAANGDDWGPWRPMAEEERSSGGLLLKLDYKEVLNSWSDKGSLFINDHGVDAQIVPEIYSDLLGHGSAINNGPSDRWTVPDHNSTMEDKECRFRQREASVLRYKEKRQNRLFAKRIRYEVRKLNAEKRPRIKGRFVRRGSEDN